MLGSEWYSCAWCVSLCVCVGGGGLGGCPREGVGGESQPCPHPSCPQACGHQWRWYATPALVLHVTVTNRQVPTRPAWCSWSTATGACAAWASCRPGAARAERQGGAAAEKLLTACGACCARCRAAVKLLGRSGMLLLIGAIVDQTHTRARWHIRNASGRNAAHPTSWRPLILF